MLRCYFKLRDLVADRMTTRSLRTVISTVGVIVAAGCGGGSNNSSVPVAGIPRAAPVGTVPVTLEMAIPSGMQRNVSGGTRSISVVMNGGPSLIVNCTDSCSATVQAPIGRDIFDFKLYDASNASGNVLSAGSMVAAISAGTPNVVLVAFSGVVKKITLSLAQLSITAGVASTIPVGVQASDSSGYVIVGAYDNPISFSNSDTSGDTALNTQRVATSDALVSLSYNGAASFSGTTIRATADGAIGDTIVLGDPCASISGVRGYYPCDLKSAYNLPLSTGGTRQTVAVVAAFDDPNAEIDLATYRRTFGLPECGSANGCFRKVNQTGGTAYPSSDTAWSGEISLDLDMVSAICANCHILLVEADSNLLSNLGSSVNTAAALGANAISNSYGGPEDASDLVSDIRYYNHPGIAITASSGDHGFKQGVNYPAASQYVTAVGGTRLVPAQNFRGWSESVWSGAGSGCSTFDPKPSWQKDPSCLMRSVADVSAIADPNPGVAVYDSFNASGWEVYGGTSVSTPIIAAVFALGADQSARNYGSNPYAHSGALYDITAGNNGSCTVAYLCTAEPGYDGPSGLGSPNGTGAFGLSPAAAGVRSPASSFRNAVMRKQLLQSGPAERVCSLPAPHYASCHAIRRTDIGAMRSVISKASP